MIQAAGLWVWGFSSLFAEPVHAILLQACTAFFARKSCSHLGAVAPALAVLETVSEIRDCRRSWMSAFHKCEAVLTFGLLGSRVSHCLGFTLAQFFFGGGEGSGGLGGLMYLSEEGAMNNVAAQTDMSCSPYADSKSKFPKP